jgi:methionyl-tRNA synthetase
MSEFIVDPAIEGQCEGCGEEIGEECAKCGRYLCENCYGDPSFEICSDCRKDELNPAP